ncbi:hypothetical protein RHMOL_Rhmol09G0142000 [Rhododendron molle]|uniref:Uncharacterized protein n=1 Tax=Rhododendron molle TaxID=49168 RepID=A0ACC0MDL5_RHOML|nr:hypothetical protein RHMOL_Rhmol09G0142000 [Rhododendron molle]
MFQTEPKAITRGISHRTEQIDYTGGNCALVSFRSKHRPIFSRGGVVEQNGAQRKYYKTCAIVVNKIAENDTIKHLLKFLCLLHSLFGVSWGLSVAGGSLFGMGFVSSSGLRVSGGGVSLFFSSFVECWICICLVMFLCSHAFAYAVIMSMRSCMELWGLSPRCSTSSVAGHPPSPRRPSKPIPNQIYSSLAPTISSPPPPLLHRLLFTTSSPQPLPP